MKKWIAVFGILLVGQISAPTVANPTPVKAVSVAGLCTKLTYRTTNLSATCSGKLVNIAYSDGRTSFLFVSGHTVISFSGDGRQQFERQRIQFFSPLDKVVFQSDGSTIGLRAVGWCDFTDTNKGIPAPIHCVAETEDGRFEGSFLTDGTRPETLGG